MRVVASHPFLPMKAAQQIAALRAKIQALKHEVAHLRVQLRSAGSELPDLPPEDIRAVFMAKLPPKAAAMMGALLAAYPRTLDRHYLDEVMPARDHAKERDLRTIDVQVVKVRKVLGPDAVETVWGRGFRLGPALVKYLSPDRRLKTELDQYAD